MGQKGTDRFREVIKAYLDNYAGRDDYFALCYENPKKSLDECVDYIITTVRASGCAGFADDEVFGMAVHYYQEDNPGKITKGASGMVVVNHQVELTDEEVAAAKQKALDKITAETMRKEQEKERRAKEAAKAKAEERKKKEASEGVLFALWD